MGANNAHKKVHVKAETWDFSAHFRSDLFSFPIIDYVVFQTELLVGYRHMHLLKTQTTTTRFCFIFDEYFSFLNVLLQPLYNFQVRKKMAEHPRTHR